MEYLRNHIGCLAQRSGLKSKNLNQPDCKVFKTLLLCVHLTIGAIMTSSTLTIRVEISHLHRHGALRKGETRHRRERTDYSTGVLMALGAAFCHALVAASNKGLKGIKPHLLALFHITVRAIILLTFMSAVNMPETVWSW